MVMMMLVETKQKAHISVGIFFNMFLAAPWQHKLFSPKNMKNKLLASFYLFHFL
jgi:hypothetical protein